MTVAAVQTGPPSRHLKGREDSGLNVEAIRAEFPILARSVRGRPLVYLDNAATTQKPASVIDSCANYYRDTNANVHRGVHRLSELATGAFESSRHRVRDFIGARESREVIFVRGATEAINLVASSFGALRVKRGDEIVVTTLEHHSNIVPWQILCERTGATLRVAPINDRGELILDELWKLVTTRTKLIALTHVSNALGTVNPVKDIIRAAHDQGVAVLVDGAQAVPHLPVRVQDLDSDFFVFSSHKMYGPMGVGVLHGKAEHLEAMPPYQSGGDMISSVTFEKTTYNRIPHKFEAGTPDVAGVIGLGRAVEFLERVGVERIGEHEKKLLDYATGRIGEVEGIRLIGTASEKAAVLSFTMGDVHPHDIGTILDEEGIAVRTGHHCAQPVMQRFGVPATVRASFGVYNTTGEVDALARGLEKVFEVFGR